MVLLLVRDALPAGHGSRHQPRVNPPSLIFLGDPLTSFFSSDQTIEEYQTAAAEAETMNEGVAEPVGGQVMTMDQTDDATTDDTTTTEEEDTMDDTADDSAAVNLQSSLALVAASVAAMVAFVV